MKNALLVTGEKEVSLQPVSTGTMGMIERASSDPNFDADKFKTLVEFRNVELARLAREAFNASMAACQRDMRPIAADANNPQTKSRYASYNALDRALRPIYTGHGFALSFNTTDCPLPDHMRVLCLVSHEGGHERPYQIDMPADGKGAKGGDVMTKTHASGAAGSYGMRYLLKMIFNVSVGEDDRDGNDYDRPAPPAPMGFQNFMDDMASAADEGYEVFGAAWKGALPQVRTYATTYHKDEMTALRVKAQAVTKAAQGAA